MRSVARPSESVAATPAASSALDVAAPCIARRVDIIVLAAATVSASMHPHEQGPASASSQPHVQGLVLPKDSRYAKATAPPIGRPDSFSRTVNRMMQAGTATTVVSSPRFATAGFPGDAIDGPVARSLTVSTPAGPSASNRPSSPAVASGSGTTAAPWGASG